MEMKKTTTAKAGNSVIDKPHDKLTRRLLSNLTTAREILESFLPKAVKDLIDLDTLQQEPGTFVNSQHRLLEVDILFKAKYKTPSKEYGEECYIYLLIEQQRQPDVWLPLRQFCYLGTIWDQIRKASKTRGKSAKLPMIYPLIISNASKPYQHSLTMRDLIEPEEAKSLFDKLFTTPSQLIDLAAIPDEQLRTQLQERVQAQALLLSLKHVFDNNLQDYLDSVLVTSFQALDQLGYKDEVVDLLFYLYNEGNLSGKPQFWAFLHQKFSENVENKMMTLGQKDRQESLEQGIEQGIEQGLKQGVERGLKQGVEKTARRMLEKKVDIQLIAEVTQLSITEIKHLAKKN
jgi:predicted transposase YdaD